MNVDDVDDPDLMAGSPEQIPPPPAPSPAPSPQQEPPPQMIDRSSQSDCVSWRTVISEVGREAAMVLPAIIATVVAAVPVMDTCEEPTGTLLTTKHTLRYRIPFTRSRQEDNDKSPEYETYQNMVRLAKDGKFVYLTNRDMKYWISPSVHMINPGFSGCDHYHNHSVLVVNGREVEPSHAYSALLVLTNDRAVCRELLRLYDEELIGAVPRHLLVRNIDTVERLINLKLFEKAREKFRDTYRVHPLQIKFIRTLKSCSHNFILYGRDNMFALKKNVMIIRPAQQTCRMCMIPRTVDEILNKLDIPVANPSDGLISFLVQSVDKALFKNYSTETSSEPARELSPSPRVSEQARELSPSPTPEPRPPRQPDHQESATPAPQAQAPHVLTPMPPPLALAPNISYRPAPQWNPGPRYDAYQVTGQPFRLPVSQMPGRDIAALWQMQRNVEQARALGLCVAPAPSTINAPPPAHNSQPSRVDSAAIFRPYM